MLYMYVATFHCPNGILGLGGNASTEKHKLKDANFNLPNDKHNILSIFCTHVQKEYHKLLELKSTSILNILALLLFEN